MKEKIMAIVKKPEEPIGHMEQVENTLEAFQELVGGNIEVVYLGGQNVLICNEEGKIHNLEPNFRLGADVICGTAIVVGIRGEDFGNVKMNLPGWKKFLKIWSTGVSA